MIAETYRDNFPDDTIIVKDVLSFVKTEDISIYDFIWTSPPCTTHTMWTMTRGYNIPDLTSLYGLILFFGYILKDTNWIVENVRPWYTPLINPTFKLGRHYFWSNRKIPEKDFKDENERYNIYRSSFGQLSKLYQLNVDRIKSLNKLDRRQIVRNIVSPEIGLYVFQKMTKQLTLTTYLTENE